MGAAHLLALNIFGVLGYGVRSLMDTPAENSINVIIFAITIVYAALALLLLVYPLSGYLADVHCGRYRAVVISFVLLWLALLLFTCAIIVAVASRPWTMNRKTTWYITLGSLALLIAVTIFISLACYQANVIQFGLNQLLEAPSGKLGLFIHWFMWAYTLGTFVTLAISVFIPCYIQNMTVVTSLASILTGVSFLFLVTLSLMLAFTWYNHGWFYTEPGQHNPYKTVIKVLHFARKNKYPLRRSAFTYCDDFSQPSRIDFAKEIFGGPFTTPQVEDVKTFFRIVLVLFSLGPLFILEVPSSYYLFPFFALHIDRHLQFIANYTSCRSVLKWGVLQSGNIGYIVSVMFFPVYIWMVYSLFRKRIPRILNRLNFAIFMPVLGIVWLLMTDIFGHYHYQNQNNSSTNLCLFTSTYFSPQNDSMPALLKLHWGVLVPPCILFNFGFVLIQATALEFISAQSPHSMKGFLIGVFFAIKGLFQFIGAAAVVPFALPSIWDHVNALTNCGFGYYLFTLVVALIGVAVFSIVVRRYKYRQRDERPYDARFVEAYYERYMQSSGYEEEHNENTHTAVQVNGDYGAARGTTYRGANHLRKTLRDISQGD